MKILRIAGILIGVVLVVVLVKEAGGAAIWSSLTLLKWKYLIVLAYPLFWIICNTVGWHYALHPQYAVVSLADLIKIRTAGETFNSLLPSSYVGGEPVKAQLLSRWMPRREAASSVLIAKAAQSLGLLLFIGLGLVVGLPSNVPPSDKLKAWIALGLLAGGVILFTVFLANGSLTRIGRFLHRMTRWSWLKSQEQRLIALDESLGVFYRDCKGRFAASVLWNGVGWIVGMFELVLIFTLMGEPISWRAAWFMGALAQLGAVIGLISPGGLGFYEGAHYVAAALLGMPPSLGLSVSLIRRIRELFWNVVGLYYFSKYSKTTG